VNWFFRLRTGIITAMDLRVLQNVDNFFASLGPVRLSRKAVPTGVTYILGTKSTPKSTRQTVFES